MASIGKWAAICAASSFSIIALAGAAPAQVIISSAATQNVTCSNGVCAPTASQAVFNVTDLENLLASGNVEITTTGSGVQADDIRIDAPFGWSASSTLTLDAYESILVGKPVAISGQGGLAVTTNDGGSGGTFWFSPKGNVTFANPSSALAIDGTSYTLVTTLPALASAIAASPSGAYALASNYDAAQDGTYSAAPIATTFTGSFEGLGSTISHLRIAGESKQMDLGLFADLDIPGSIASLRLTGAYIKAKGQSYVGAIAGLSYGTIFNAFASGNIRAAAGRNAGAVIGGLVGGNGGEIRGTGTAMKIHIGSKAQGTRADAGGLVGANGGTVDASYAAGPVVMTGPAGESVGGLMAFNQGTVEDCYAEGVATEQGVGATVGGLIGLDYMTVENSYSAGAPAGGDRSVVGGSVGYDDHGVDDGTISHTYWDMTTSGIKKNQGAGNIPNDPGIKGKTTKQLRSGLPNGFDPKIWAENPKINGGLPYLIDNPPQ